MPWTQKERLLAVETPLGPDVLLLTGFRGSEGISRPFELELTMLSENHNISFENIVGKRVTASVSLADGSKRCFNGYVSKFSQGRGGGEKAGDPRFSFYRATVVPWFWLLTRTANLRIFQKVPVKEIVEKIFSEKGFQDYSFRLDKTYEKREYCVQYRETDFNFISRLLEDEGIYYFFEHENGKHTMVFADTPDKHKPCVSQKTARYHLHAGGWMEEDVITALEKTQEIRAGKYTLTDYDFEKPRSNLKVEAPSKQKLGPGDREIYDYPGLYVQRPDGERLTNIRMEEEEARITTITGSSVCRAFTSGYRFALMDHYRGDMNNKEYVLTEISHEAKHSVEYAATEILGKEEELSYVNHFSCIPFDIPYRPPRHTPKPVVEGTQTAIVVGPPSEEIYTDGHGRVKVQFHWDREGKRDENSSCWIRVSQLWAGGGWGAVYIPRIGHEVIVDFLEGDPDRPIIIGRVYHGNNKLPYPLPSQKTKSTIKSDSTPGSGGSNEIRFDDAKGAEELFIHGQYNMNTVVENSQSLVVHNCRTSRIDVDETRTVGSNQTISVGANQSLSIGGNQSASVGGNQSVSVGANQSTQVGGSKTEQIGGSKTVTVGGAGKEEVGGNRSFTVGGDFGVEAGSQVSINGGGGVKVTGPKIDITAGGEVNISAGGSGIKIGPAGITISSGGVITLQASLIKNNS